MAINSHDGAAQEELTAFVGGDKAMTTRVIHSLESKGLVKRVQDAKDDLDIFMRTLAVLEKNISNFLKEEK